MEEKNKEKIKNWVEFSKNIKKILRTKIFLNTMTIFKENFFY